MSSPISRNVLFAAQVVGGCASLAAGTMLLMQNIGGPCYTPGPQGYVIDQNKGISLSATVVTGSAFFYTGASLAAKIVEVVSNCFSQPQPHRFRGAQ